MAGGSLSWSGVKEGEMKMTHIVYLQPGSIYLVVSTKTSSVRNMISLRQGFSNVFDSRTPLTNIIYLKYPPDILNKYFNNLLAHLYG